MPIVKQKPPPPPMYLCDLCSEDEEDATKLNKAGGFKNVNKKITFEVFHCPKCQAIYISMNGDFIEGYFEQI